MYILNGYWFVPVIQANVVYRELSIISVSKERDAFWELQGRILGSMVS